MSLALEQILNGLQFGVMIFLLAAGLTLVFGIMGVINLAHGSIYMLGAYVAASAAAAAAVAGLVIELVVIRRLYLRDHLDQVLATFALILIANDGVSIAWGKTPLNMTMPPALAGAVSLGGLTYPTYRLLPLAHRPFR